MTTRQLREWLFENSLEDQWWLRIYSVTEENPLTLAEVERELSGLGYEAAELLHVSQAGLANPSWIGFETTPSRSAYRNAARSTPQAKRKAGKDRPSLILMIGLPFVGILALAALIGALFIEPNEEQQIGPSQLIEYRIVSREEAGNFRVSFDVLVGFQNHGGALREPTKPELAAISRHLVSSEVKHERSFVTFYLPGMKVGAGAWATAHHDPSLRVEILRLQADNVRKTTLN